MSTITSSEAAKAVVRRNTEGIVQGEKEFLVTHDFLAPDISIHALEGFELFLREFHLSSPS